MSGTTGTSIQDTPRERREGQMLEDKSVRSNGPWRETKPKESEARPHTGVEDGTKTAEQPQGLGLGQW